MNTTLAKPNTSLTPNEAMLLQQIYEDGEDDTRTLSQQLGMSRPHVINVISHLKRKGLVVIDNQLDGLWVQLTRRGRELMRYMWPEARSSLI